MNPQRILSRASLCALLLFAAFSASAQEPFKVTAVLRNMTLAFTVTNITGKDISLAEYQLPWGYPYSTLIIGAVAEHPMDRLLLPPRPLDDPPVKMIVLAAGKSASGFIDLVERLPGLKSCLAKSDVAVFWMYAYQPHFSGPPSRTLGSLIIPRTRTK